MEIVKNKISAEKYPSYKDSGVEWLGDIPEHWEVKKIKYLFNIGRGRVIAQTELVDDGKYPVYSSQTLNNGVLGYIETYDYDCKQITWTTDGVNAGTVFLRSGKHNCTNVCGTLQSRTHSQVIEFIANSLKISAQYYKRPDTNGAKIMNGEMAEIFITLPPVSEQTIIAQFLDTKTTKIDQALKIKEQQISLLKERKQILIHKTVTRGLDDSVTLKDSGVEWIGEIPEHWAVKRFRYVFNLGKGLTITKDNLRDEGVFCVNYGEIHSKYGFEIDTNIHKLKCVEEEYLLGNPKALINKGDFVFADTSEDIEGSGNFTYLKSEDEIFAGYHTVIAKPKFKIDSRFFAYVFESESFRNQIRTKVKGVKVYSITQSILKEPTVWYPSKEEQIKIVNFLDVEIKKIDTAVSLKQQEIEKLKEYKSSLINDVVTGKVKVC